MPYKDREKANEYERNRYNRRKKNPEWMNRLRVRRRKNSKAFFKRAMNDPIKKEALYKKIRVYQRKWIHLPHVKTKRQQYCWNLKMDCLRIYGGNPPKCACCGEKEPKFLSLDHKKGGGNKHRKKVGASTQFYCWLRKNNFPKKLGLRVLCYNCNMSSGFFGKCPHNK